MCSEELPPKNFFPVQQLAARYNVSDKTIIRMIEGKSLNALRVGRQYKIPRESILNFEAAQLAPVERKNKRRKVLKHMKRF